MRRTVLLFFAALVALAGCGGAGSVDPKAAASQAARASQSAAAEARRVAANAAADASAAASASAAAGAAQQTNANGAALNSHGNIPKAIGQEGGMTDTPGGPAVLTFSIDAIRVDPPCNAPASSKPLNGHYVVATMRVTTTPGYTGSLVIDEKDFSIIGPDGVTVTDVAGYGFTCMRNRFFDLPLHPGQTYRGEVILDSPVTAGSLIFAPPDAQTGWEWQIP